MTSAAAPATSGAAWLVPPLAVTSDGWPRKLTHEEYSGDGVHEAKDASPGATRSRVRPFWVKPPDDSELMLPLSQPPGANWSAPAKLVCA